MIIIMAQSSVAPEHWKRELVIVLTVFVIMLAL